MLQRWQIERLQRFISDIVARESLSDVEITRQVLVYAGHDCPPGQTIRGEDLNAFLRFEGRPPIVFHMSPEQMETLDHLVDRLDKTSLTKEQRLVVVSRRAKRVGLSSEVMEPFLYLKGLFPSEPNPEGIFDRNILLHNPSIMANAESPPVKTVPSEQAVANSAGVVAISAAIAGVAAVIRNIVGSDVQEAPENPTKDAQPED